MKKLSQREVIQDLRRQIDQLREQVSSLEQDLAAAVSVAAQAGPKRRRLPDERPGLDHKFSIAGHEGYIIAGTYEDGTLGEIFVQMAKTGSTLNGLMDALAIAVSLGLQYGVPIEAYVRKFTDGSYEPSGHTENPEIPTAKSITDYIFRWLGLRFGGKP